MLVGALATALFAAPGPAPPAAALLDVDEAVAAAQSATRDVLRAQADLLLVDIDKARALAAILPSVSLSLGVSESFSAQNVEARYATYEIPGCSGPSCAATLAPGGTYDLEYHAFYDAFADPISQPLVTLGISARQLLFDGGRWWRVLSRNGDLRAQQAAGLAIARAAARLNAVRRFYELIKARESVRVAELQLARAEAQLERSRVRLAAGEVGPDAVATAERNLAVDRVSAMQRRFSASNQARALNLAMGREPEEPLELRIPQAVRTATAPVAALSLPDQDDLLARALARRPELLQLRALTRVVDDNIGIRRADRWPVLALTAGYARSSRRPDRVFGDPTRNYSASVGLNLSWTALAGGAVEANIDEATLELNKAESALAEQQRLVKSEVLEKRERLTILLGVHANAVEGARAARRARTLVEARAAEGKASALELRDAEILESQAVQSAIESRLDIEVGKAELLRAVGAEADDLAL